MVFSIDARLELCSPEGIRTLVADLRSQSPRPLDDGAVPIELWWNYSALGYQDSNLDLLKRIGSQILLNHEVTFCIWSQPG